jgi:Zeta toxin
VLQCQNPTTANMILNMMLNMADVRPSGQSDLLPEDWQSQVIRAYQAFDVNPLDDFDLDGVDELALFGGKLDPDFLREKAKQQMRDVKGKFREMRARLPGKKKDKAGGPGEVDPFEPPIRRPAREIKPNQPAKPVPAEKKPPRTDVYKGRARDSEGRVIFTEDDLQWFKGENSLVHHLVDSTDADGNPVKALTKEREALHRELVNRVLDGIEPPKGRNPLQIFLGGGPGSGKTSATQTVSDFPKTREMKDYGSKPPGEAALIDADGFKAEMPEWGQPNPQESTQFVHGESGLLADLALDEAQRRKVDIVLDGTGDSGEKAGKAKIQKARDAGFDVAAMYVTAPASESMMRAVSRAIATGRMVKPEIVDRIHKDVSDTFGKIKGEFGDKVDLYDADVPRGAAGLPIIRDGKIVDQAKYDEFMAKREIEFETSVKDAIARAKDPSKEFNHTKDMTADQVRAKTIEILEDELDAYTKARKSLQK